MSEINYSTITSRIKAAFFDTIFIILLILTYNFILETLEINSTVIKSVGMVSILFLYEPLLVTILGATVGHMFMDIRIKDKENPTKNINILSAILRFIVKIFLGWFSLVTVSNHSEKRAIHDLVGNSIVISV